MGEIASPIKYTNANQHADRREVVAMKETARRLIALLLCLGVLAVYPMYALAVKVDYNRKGSLEVRLEMSQGLDRSGVVFSLYQIGEIDNVGDGIGYHLSGSFPQAGVTLDYTTSQAAETAALALSAFIRSKGIAPRATARTSTTGLAVFALLDAGVYFGEHTSGGPGGLKVMPFIISVPYFSDDSLTYNAAVQPKWEIVPTPTPTPCPTPTPTPKPPRPPKPTPEPQLPQTGVLRWPAIALGVGSAVLILFGVAAFIAARKKEKQGR